MKLFRYLSVMLLLSGCIFGYDSVGYQKINMASIFYKDIFVEPVLMLRDADELHIKEITYSKIYPTDTFDFKSSEVWIDLYQDIDRQCYLYSISNIDIITKKNKVRESLYQSGYFKYVKENLDPKYYDMYEQIQDNIVVVIEKMV